eukprot:gene7313-8510_t
MPNVTFDINFKIDQIPFILPYPYGYIERLQSGMWTYKTSLVSGVNTKQAKVTAYGQFTHTSTKTYDLSTQTNIQVMAINSYSYAVRINVSDTSGVLSIQWDNVKILAADLRSGTEFNGVYVARIGGSNTFTKTPTVTFQNTALNSLQLDYHAPFNFNGMRFPALPKLLEFTIQDITAFDIMYRNVDLTDGPFKNTLFFRLSTQEVNARPRLSLFESTTVDQKCIEKSHSYLGSFDAALDMYRIDFWIPKQSNVGIFPFTLHSSNTFTTNSDLMSRFGANATLNIRSTLYGDLMRPLAIAIVQYPTATVTTDVNTAMLIGWNITIEDSPNTFKDGVAKIISDIDYEPYVVYFNASDLISGDASKGVYAIRFPIHGNCVSQNYYINELTLNDKGELDLVSQNGMQTLIGGPYHDARVIKVICTDPTWELDQPKLVEFKVLSSRIEVFSMNRTLEFQLNTTDTGSPSTGMSKRHGPYVYITAQDGSTFSIQSKATSYSFTHTMYKAVGELPYGFGVGPLMLSVYGINDNHNTIRGYTSYMLKNAIFPYYLTRATSVVVPYLESHSIITNQGGVIFINGKNFPDPINSFSFHTEVDYNNGAGYLSIPFVTNYWGVAIEYFFQPFTASSIKVRVKLANDYSNVLIVVPVDFSYLIDPNKASDVCSKSSGLSTGKIAAIAVGAGVAVLAIVIGVTLYTKKKLMFAKQDKKMQAKLQRIN